jgi:hypothetical protein
MPPFWNTKTELHLKRTPLRCRQSRLVHWCITLSLCNVHVNMAGYMAAVPFEIPCLRLWKSTKCVKRYFSSSPIKVYHKRTDKANGLAKKCRYSGKLHSVQSDIQVLHWQAICAVALSFWNQTLGISMSRCSYSGNKNLFTICSLVKRHSRTASFIFEKIRTNETKR